ncbi:acyl-CoA dehydrogenase family protein [Rhodococcus koreensis]|uniref:acyl-CoA dehydrogenase family protein n=1 Tax=Rhodococcus koreensis TaxID=99653 RepID=UPI0036DDA2B2
MTDEVVHAAETMVERTFGHIEARANARRAGWSTEMWKAAADAGWFDILLAEDVGGLGFDTSTAAGLFSLIGAELVPGAFLEHMVVLPLLYPHAPETLLPRLKKAREGSSIVALGDSEATGNDPRAHAVIENDGRLHGWIPMVRYAQRADAFFVICDRGSSTDVVYLPATTPGLHLESRSSIDPTFPVADLRLEGVEVRAEDTLRTAGTRPVSETLVRLRSTIRQIVSAELAGLSRHLLDSSVEYAKQRHQFGRAIGSFQPVQQILADMTLDVFGLEAYVEDAASSNLRDQLSAVALKGFASKSARRVGEAALQIHGGIAFTAEFDLHQWFLRVLSLQGLYGDESASFLDAGRTLVTEDGVG